jgi:hypothetical protein
MAVAIAHVTQRPFAAGWLLVVMSRFTSCPGALGLDATGCSKNAALDGCSSRTDFVIWAEMSNAADV